MDLVRNNRRCNIGCMDGSRPGRVVVACLETLASRTADERRWSAIGLECRELNLSYRRSGDRNYFLSGKRTKSKYAISVPFAVGDDQHRLQNLASEIGNAGTMYRVWDVI